MYLKKHYLILSLFVSFFILISFVFAVSTKVSLTIQGSYTGNIFFDTTYLTLKDWIYYTDRNDISFFVSATKSSNYILTGDLVELMGSGTWTYTHLHTVSTQGLVWDISFKMFFSHSWEVIISNTLHFVKIDDLHLSSSSWWKSWWWGFLYKDSCPEGDSSWSYYDGICNFHSVAPDELIDPDTDSGLIQKDESDGVEFNFSLSRCIDKLYEHSPGFNQELALAYRYAYNLWIINSEFCNIIDEQLTRIRMAEIMSLYATKVLKITQVHHFQACDKFDDISDLDLTRKNYAILSCQLGLMWLYSDQKSVKESFEPHKFVSRAEFGTVLSRLLFGYRYVPKLWQQRYENHLLWLRTHNILHYTNPEIQEYTPWVLLMLWRNKDTNYSFLKTFEDTIIDSLVPQVEMMQMLSSPWVDVSSLDIGKIALFVQVFFWL